MILKNFLKEYKACENGYLFAKDLTLEEFLNTCPRGDWILWLFARTNPNSIREIALAAGHSANTVRDLMEDERSTKAVDATIAFGEGRIEIEELKVAARDAYSAYSDAAYSACAADAYAACAAYAAYSVAAVVACAADAYATVDAVVAARKENQKLTADICRKYFPLDIWNQESLTI